MRIARFLANMNADERIRRAEDAKRAEAEYRAKQDRIDGLLPGFLVSSPMAAPVGTRWVTLADLAINQTTDWSTPDDRSQVGFIYDLATGSMPSEGSLPGGSTLCLLEPYWEMWAYGYLAGIFFDLRVEDGPRAGMTVTIGDYTRTSWSNGVVRRTLAASLIVPDRSPEIGNPVAIRARYAIAAGLLREEPMLGWPNQPREEVVRETDRAALWEPSTNR